MGTGAGRAVIAAAALGSGIAFLDGTVVNVALRSIGEDLDASLAQLQWITNGYLLSLASLILLGGSLGDRFGRRRVFVIGTIWFAAASLLCGLAPNPEVLIAARVLQGVGGALLTPGSLAMIQGAFVAGGPGAGDRRLVRAGRHRRARSGRSSAAGSCEYADWRWIFLINLPIAALTVFIAVRAVPETRDPHASVHFDIAGGGAGHARPWPGRRTRSSSGARPRRGGAAVVAVLAGGRVRGGRKQRRRSRCWCSGSSADRTFSASNVMTLLVYGALGAQGFFVTIQLQTVSGYGALAAGAAFVPTTIVMLLLASPGGRLGQRIGPRIPMTVGPIVIAVGVLLMLLIGPDVNYVRDVLPGAIVFGLGLSLMIAPLTATVLAAAPDEHAGIASGVNNAVARAGALLAVAALPVAVGLHGAEYADPVAFDDAFRMAMMICAVLLAVGGVVSWFTIRDTVLEPDDEAAPEPLDGGTAAD